MPKAKEHQDHPLQKYLDAKKLTHGDFAPKVNVSPSMVSHWITGRCPVTAEKAKLIEKKTSGEVPRYKLRPDLFDAPQRVAP